VRPRYTEAIIAPTPNSAGIAAKPSLPDLVLSITDQVANAQTHADDHSAIRSWFLEVIQRFSLSSAEPGLAIHPIVSKCRIRADDAMTATGRYRSVRFSASELPSARMNRPRTRGDLPKLFRMPFILNTYV
jgi:hypothetical protein